MARLFVVVVCVRVAASWRAVGVRVCAVCAGFPVASQGGGGLCGVFVCCVGIGVHFVSVVVVVVLRVFDVGVHDVGGVVCAFVGVFGVLPAVRVSCAAFVAFGGECVAVVGGGGCWCFVVAGVSSLLVFRRCWWCCLCCWWLLSSVVYSSWVLSWLGVVVLVFMVGFFFFSPAGSYVCAWWVWCA